MNGYKNCLCISQYRGIELEDPIEDYRHGQSNCLTNVKAARVDAIVVFSIAALVLVNHG